MSVSQHSMTVGKLSSYTSQWDVYEEMRVRMKSSKTGSHDTFGRIVC